MSQPVWRIRRVRSIPVQRWDVLRYDRMLDAFFRVDTVSSWPEAMRRVMTLSAGAR